MSKKDKQQTTVGFVALGCPKNVVDSERMLAEIAQAGFLITAESDNADVVVINTCGFIAPARAEAIEAIKNAVGCKAGGTVKKVIVAGCLAEKSGAELFNCVDGIDAVVGLGQRDAIAQIIGKTISSEQPAAYLGHSPQAFSDDRTRLLITPSHWAYLRVSDGCDHKCSFCTIPAIRGRFRSKPLENVLAEAAELVTAGVVELNVIAQDTTCYGRDLKMKDGLGVLLRGLEEIDGLSWVRLMYLYPAGITDGLIETIAASERIVYYFDVPIQHINDDILRGMRRPDTKKGICRLIEKIRSAMPDAVLRTTIIAGLPGETDQSFDELLGFVKWARFDALGCFKYCPEAGTEAAEMPGQVPERIKQERFERLMLIQQKIVFEKNQERIGGKLTCLIDSVDNGTVGRGRFYGQAPDIDGICIVKNCSAAAGSFVDVKVVGVEDYDLLTEQI